MYLVSVAMVHVINDYYFLQYTVWFRFGSVRFRFLVFAIGPVRFMFGFGSCGSWFGSVRCLEHSTLIFAFFPAPEKQIQIASCKRFISFIASRKRFHEPRLSKSGES